MHHTRWSLVVVCVCEWVISHRRMPAESASKYLSVICFCCGDDDDDSICLHWPVCSSSTDDVAHFFVSSPLECYTIFFLCVSVKCFFMFTWRCAMRAMWHWTGADDTVGLVLFYCVFITPSDIDFVVCQFCARIVAQIAWAQRSVWMRPWLRQFRQRQPTTNWEWFMANRWYKFVCLEGNALLSWISYCQPMQMAIDITCFSSFFLSFSLFPGLNILFCEWTHNKRKQVRFLTWILWIRISVTQTIIINGSRSNREFGKLYKWIVDG